MIRQLLAIITAGFAGHGLILGAVLGAGLGGAYSAFAATAIQFALVTAVFLRVAADGIMQAALLALGPFFAPVLAAVAMLALLCVIGRRRGLTLQVFGAALLTVLPMAVRYGDKSPGGPAIGVDDLVLVAAAGAVSGFLYWLIAGRRIARQAAIRG